MANSTYLVRGLNENTYVNCLAQSKKYNSIQLMLAIMGEGVHILFTLQLPYAMRQKIPSLFILTLFLFSSPIPNNK